MKKGISLIVLVITIIVLAILAGAIIVSLSSTNVIEQANSAVKKADRANASNVIAMEYAAAVARGTDGKAYKEDGTTIMKQADYEKILSDQGFKVSGLIVAFDEDTGRPTVATD